jgi:hypothetical protein
MNETGNWMWGGMWGWAVIGALVIVAFVVAISRTNRR